ncbi:MAG: helix-turn-helix transcriptional regulator [Verrucomicrobia bacterium]|nr:helix-turn-helix transcriptional regulator [Verrucomicrobiota bacterium]
MSSVNGKRPCLGELAAAGAPPPAGLRPPPPCDYAEAAVWEALGGGWQCLHGCFCQCGVSIEWHEFTCAEPRDWARSFHPDSVELCFNLSGHARISAGPDSALFGPMTTGCYFAGQGALAAWRLPGERHEFLTVEFARDFLERHLQGCELALDAVLRRALRPESHGRSISEVERLTPALRKAVEGMRQPPVSGAAQHLWYQGKALELMAQFFFQAGPATAQASPLQRLVARDRVERAIQILSGRLAEPPSLEDLGREVGCSPYHLSRTFSREMGLTIPQYLRQIRMERAAEMLKSGQFNVTEAALEVGYSSLSHFSHAFRETMGCCPGLYPLNGAPAFRPLPPTAAGGAQSAAKTSQRTGSKA